MSHFRHPSLREPVAVPVRPAIRYAADRGRNYYIGCLRHGYSPTASANPYHPGTREHDIWFAALLTEASDLLEILAGDNAAGSFTCFG